MVFRDIGLPVIRQIPANLLLIGGHRHYLDANSALGAVALGTHYRLDLLSLQEPILLDLQIVLAALIDLAPHLLAIGIGSFGVPLGNTLA